MHTGIGCLQPQRDLVRYFRRNATEAACMGITSVQDMQASIADTTNGKPLFVDMFATWCGYSKKMAPPVAALAGTNGRSVTFKAVGLDMGSEQASIATANSIHSYPIFITYACGHLCQKITGANLPAVQAAVDYLSRVTCSNGQKPSGCDQSIGDVSY